MDSKRCGSGHCGVVQLDNVRLYVSYGTVVGIEAFGKAHFTDRKHSVTTSKQRTTKLYPAAGQARVNLIPHADFLTLCRTAGVEVIRHTFYGQSVDDAISPVTF